MPIQSIDSTRASVSDLATSVKPIFARRVSERIAFSFAAGNSQRGLQQLCFPRAHGAISQRLFLITHGYTQPHVQAPSSRLGYPRRYIQGRG